MHCNLTSNDNWYVVISDGLVMDCACVVCDDPTEENSTVLTGKGYPTLFEYSCEFKQDHPGLSTKLAAKRAANENITLHRAFQKRVIIGC